MDMQANINQPPHEREIGYVTPCKPKIAQLEVPGVCVQLHREARKGKARTYEEEQALLQ
jgi:hypothetical protein